MIVKGPRIHEDFRDFTKGSRCEKHLEALSKKKKIDLRSIGSSPNNLLLEFLKCHNKSSNTNSNSNTNTNTNTNSNTNDAKKNNRKSIEKSYASCHASVMGTGNYNGKKHCGDELKQWLDRSTATVGSSSCDAAEQREI